MEKQEVINLMRSSKNSQEWNANCNIVKQAHNCGYPAYWYQEIILSGLCDEVLGAGASKITIHRILKVKSENIPTNYPDTTEGT